MSTHSDTSTGSISSVVPWCGLQLRSTQVEAGEEDAWCREEEQAGAGRCSRGGLAGPGGCEQERLQRRTAQDSW